MSTWPELNYQEMKPTLETLHRWIQILGKLRMCLSPWQNHSWSTALYVTSRGLTTSGIPLDDRILTVEFDFVDHELLFNDSRGMSFVMLLQNESVASFYERFLEALELFNVRPKFQERPNEVEDATPFREDEHHRSYNPLHAHAFFQTLVRASNIFQDYRADFLGKSSPVHFFFGAMDLAVTRFSGRKAPEHPAGIPNLCDRVVKEAYSHEVMSVGFWPGNDMYPKAAFYAYAYPEPEGFSKIEVPGEAYYHPELREFILDYDLVRESEEPESLIREFLEMSYLGAADLAGWDRELLEESKFIEEVREKMPVPGVKPGNLFRAPSERSEARP